MKRITTALFAMVTLATSTSAMAGWVNKHQIPISGIPGGNFGSTQISSAQTRFGFDACQYRLKAGNRFVMISNFEVNGLFTQLNFSETSSQAGSTLHREYNVMVSPSTSAKPQASVYVISKVILGAGLGKDAPISETHLIVQENCPSSSGISIR